ncbi:PLP-dependent transferase [Amniculicola lignicola CBS 123094]|uniref:PLP-dependent transferase n=1 Tax=Amniculicola lignicola CBS 123094 TaxID=1392246 RepID=A0A6A5WBE6_9PLEO|nr:PLP-dependent transferase [Amniculicola lignicola CBS 123094]
MPKIKGAVEERKSTDTTKIDLSTAENWLIRTELMEICKDAITQRLNKQHFSYPRGFSGNPDLLEAYASIFNNYFHPHTPIVPSHISTAPGASGCIDALLYNICDPGDGVMIPGPYWNGFDFGIKVRSSVTPVLVSLSTFKANFTEELILTLEETIKTSTFPIKALMITNPHNPLGLCYPRGVLEECLKFCDNHGIHFISDEVYALSKFENPEIQDPVEFTSVLSLDLNALRVDPSRVHMVWSTSKDFGQSGFRMAITQANNEMAVALALAANTQISSLSTIFVTSLLTSPKLPKLIALNSQRLAQAYTTLTGFFKELSIKYVPCNAGLYVFAKLARQAQTWEDESSVISDLKSSGILVSAGRAYHGPENEKGWMRVGFAVDPDQLTEAIRRMKTVLTQMTEKPDRTHQEQ